MISNVIIKSLQYLQNNKEYFNKIISILVISTIYLSSIVYPQQNNTQQEVKFEKIGIEDGLSQSMVLAILQDSKGFMWFGTEDGLNRYDGYEFKIYRHNPDDPNSLCNNYVQTLFEDRDGIIWIGTYGGGLVQFNPKIEQFICYQNDPNNANSLAHNDVKTITQDPEGFIWIGTYGGGLDRLDINTNQFTHYKFHENEFDNLNNNYVFKVLYDVSGYLWIGTIGGGLNCLNLETGLFTHFLYNPRDSSSISSNSITALIQDNEGFIWIGTLDGDINKFIPESKDTSKQNAGKFKRFFNNSNFQNEFNVWALYQDQANNLWVGTSDGLIKMDIVKEQFIQYRVDYGNKWSVSDNEIFSIYQDQGGVLWIGTGATGINKIDTVGKKFELFQNIPDNSNSLNDNTIYSIYENNNGILWAGTSSGGLNRIDRATGNVIHYMNIPGDRFSLSHNRVQAIYEDSGGTIWAASENGLNEIIFEDDLSKKTKIRFIRYMHSPLDPHSISGENVTYISEDKNGKIWFGTYSGLNCLDPNTEQFTRYLHNSDDPGSLSSNVVSTLLFDQNDMLWIGTWNGGLNRLTLNTKEGTEITQSGFTHFKHDSDDPGSISNNFILSLLEDNIGNIWIGTSSGLNKYDQKTETFKHFTVKDGLPNNIINGILEDSQGNLWISTNNGLSKFDQKTERFTNYNTSDGLQSNEFNISACYKSFSGEMFFGGVNGFNAFYPENIKDNSYIPPIVITDFQLFNEPVSIGKSENGNSILTKSIIATEKMELSYKDVLFSFEFASLNFANSEENKYAYMMQGFDEDWIYSGNRRFVTFTNLDPGKYVFRVKGSNDDDVWNEEGISVNITIVPPFWQTWWFRIIVTIITLSAVYYFYRKRINKVEAKKKELQKRIEEKTKTAEQLQNAFNEVEALKKQLEAENVYLQDEIKFVNNFENIITHNNEFKKILGRVEQVAATDATVLILGESGTGKELIARAIHNISNRSRRLLVKVNCAALPANLIESELFGHDKGAFTGAISRKIGRFELANNSTIFLDEIGDLSMELQTKLLRVLQEGEFERLGNSNTIKVDVRIVAATNRDIMKGMENGTFREDLFYRLNVFPITIPPLRERKDDIPLLVKHFLTEFCNKTGKNIRTVTKNVMDELINYDWPGNIRELENIIERAVIVSSTDKLVVGNWFPKSNKIIENRAILTFEENERKNILDALNSTNWRISGPNGAAKILGINATTLDYRIKKLGLKK